MTNSPGKINEEFLSKWKLSDIGRYYVSRFVAEVASSLPDGARVLDAGAGECAYKSLFWRCHYEATDLAVGEASWNYENLDHVGPLHDMPVADDSFDAVLCTQVLEHLEWPRESVREMHRVLKPGGRLYMTVPMSHAEHQVPFDFFRYTSYGLRSICTHAGFTEVEIRPLGGSYVRWAYDLPIVLFSSSQRDPNLATTRLSHAILYPLRGIARMLLFPLQQVLLWLDHFDSRKDHPFGWSVVARKRE